MTRSTKPIETNKDLVDVLNAECDKFDDTYSPLHPKHISYLKAAQKLVAHGHKAVKNPGKSRASTILTGLWAHAQEAYVLCALATSQSTLGTLKTIDYMKAVMNWWEERSYKPQGLLAILHRHTDILPPLSNFVTTTTTVAQLASLIRKAHGDGPLTITCPYSGNPPPFIRIGTGPDIKVELSTEMFVELLRTSDEGVTSVS